MIDFTANREHTQAHIYCSIYYKGTADSYIKMPA